jgi:hypothetical protein
MLEIHADFGAWSPAKPDQTAETTEAREDRDFENFSFGSQSISMATKIANHGSQIS